MLDHDDLARRRSCLGVGRATECQETGAVGRPLKLLFCVCGVHRLSINDVGRQE